MPIEMYLGNRFAHFYRRPGTWWITLLTSIGVIIGFCRRGSEGGWGTCRQLSGFLLETASFFVYELLLGSALAFSLAGKHSNYL